MLIVFKNKPCLLFISLFITSFFCSAVDQGARVYITATVVAPPPCVINEGQPINVEFGKVGVNRINGSNYMQRLDYAINCDFLDPSRQLQMKIMGNPASFDSRVLTTNINGLGVMFLANGNEFDINTSISIDYTNPPTIDAVPVKSPNLNLNEGEFTTGATMLVEYF